MASPGERTIEVTGSSTATLEDAIRDAVAKASRTVQSLRWFELLNVRGGIDGESVSRWEATVRLGFSSDEDGV